MSSAKQRNWQLGFLKGVSCLFVVGDLIIDASIFPVPLFFMISGYYACTKDGEWLQRNTLSILKILLLTKCLYGLWYCLRTLLSGESSAVDYLRKLSLVTHPVGTLLCGTLFEGTL